MVEQTKNYSFAKTAKPTPSTSNAIPNSNQETPVAKLEVAQVVVYDSLKPIKETSKPTTIEIRLKYLRIKFDIANKPPPNPLNLILNYKIEYIIPSIRTTIISNLYEFSTLQK